MNQWPQFRFALACIACSGWLFAPLHAAEATENANATSMVPDLRLDAKGQLHGRLVDADGGPLAGSVIQLRNRAEVVAVATTTATGEFELRAPRGGLFTVSAGGGFQPVRCWTTAAAPPHAITQFHVVQGTVARGQGCTATSCTGTCGGTCDACGGGMAGRCMGFLMNPIVVGTAIAAAIAIPLAIDDDDAS